MIEVAIVEDEPDMADALSDFITRYAEEKQENIAQSRFSCTTDFLSCNDKYDIVFMDIQFKNDMDGVRAARKLREKDSSVTLIFVTAFEQFAVKGYEVEAYDFIVKPISYRDFSLRMSRAVKHIQKERDDVVNIKTAGRVKIISINDIKYIEVIKHKLYFHTLNGIIDGNGTLLEMETFFADKYFARCNNCYLINLRYVTATEGYVVTVAGENLSISRPRRKEFLSALNRYLAR